MCVFCFNFDSVFLIISFLLNIGKKMSVFCFYFRSVFYCLGFFSSKHGKKTKPRKENGK